MSKPIQQRTDRGEILKPVRKLVRKRGGLAGVAGGIATYFSWNPTVIRLAFIVGTFFSGAGLLAYLILAAVIPKERSENLEEDARFSSEDSSHTIKENVHYVSEEPAREDLFEDVRIVCPNCETVGKPNSNFCHKCGTALL